MVHKLTDLYPKLSHINGDDLDFTGITAVVIPVVAAEKIEITKTEFLKKVTALTKIDLNIELANWPDFTAKAGEIIEVPITLDDLNLSLIHI